MSLCAYLWVCVIDPPSCGVVFDKLPPNKNKSKKSNADTTKYFKPGEKIYSKEYKNEEVGWKEGNIKKRIRRLV